MAMPATVTAQEGELTLDDLFATPKLTGTTPSRPAWAPNSEHFAFSWSEPGNPGRGLWVSTSDGKEVRLSSNTASASVRDIVWTDATTIVSLRGNSLWQTSLSQGDDFQIMTVEAGARNLSISPSGDQAAYIRNGDLWLADFPTKQNRQITEIGIGVIASSDDASFMIAGPQEIAVVTLELSPEELWSAVAADVVIEGSTMTYSGPALAPSGEDPTMSVQVACEEVTGLGG